jgi:hypothetical protein
MSHILTYSTNILSDGSFFSAHCLLSNDLRVQYRNAKAMERTTNHGISVDQSDVILVMSINCHNQDAKRKYTYTQNNISRFSTVQATVSV